MKKRVNPYLSNRASIFHFDRSGAAESAEGEERFTSQGRKEGASLGRSVFPAWGPSGRQLGSGGPAPQSGICACRLGLLAPSSATYQTDPKVWTD